MSKISNKLKKHLWPLLIVALLCISILQNYHNSRVLPFTAQLQTPETLSHSLTAFDEHLEAQFDRVRDSLLHNLKKGEPSDRLVEALTAFEGQTRYGAVLSSHNLGCDPLWHDFVLSLNDVLKHSELSQLVTQEEYAAFAQFMEEHAYKDHGAPITRDDMSEIQDMVLKIANRA